MLSVDIEIIQKDNPQFQNYINLERGAKSSPEIIFKPDSHLQVQQIIKYLNEEKKSAVIFAGNTGLVSAQRAEGEAVIDLNYLNNIISLEIEGNKFTFSKLDKKISQAKKAEIWFDELKKFSLQNNYFNQFSQVILEAESSVAIGTINYVLKAINMELPIDTGAVWVGGGMSAGAAVANASHGTYGLLYGKASDLVVEVTAINGNGSERLDKLDIKTPFFSEDEVIINSAKAQYGDSSIGTQGTFAVITKVKFKIFPMPTQQHYFLIKTNSIVEINFIRKNLHKKFPKNLRQFEFLSYEATEIIRQNEFDNFINPFNLGQKYDSKFVVLLEFVNSNNHPDIQIEEVYNFITSELKISDDNISYGGQGAGDPEKFIKMRHAVSSASNKYALKFGSALEHRITPDISVPPKNIEAFYSDIIKFTSSENCEAVFFGHIGIGSFHLHIFTPEEKPLSEVKNNSAYKDYLIENIFDIVCKHQGSCWSEHGVGTANAKLYKKYTPPKYYNEWLSYKKKYDANNVLSPKSNGFF